MALAIQLQEDNIIKIASKSFELSDDFEITTFIVKYNPVKHGGQRLFPTRIVREIKGKRNS